MEGIFNKNLFKDKVVIVTGGGTGINYQIALDFLKHGASVCIFSRKLHVIEQAVNNLKNESQNENTYGLSCDVRKYEEVVQTINLIIQKFGLINIVINGAAGNFLANFDNLSTNAFRTVIEIDTIGAFNVSKAVYQLSFKNILNQQNNKRSQIKVQNEIIKSSSDCVIINISANLYQHGVYMQMHAGAAKAALDALTNHLAVELGPKGVRVIGISPGPIQGTEGFDRLSSPQDQKDQKQKQSTFEDLQNSIPLQRFGFKQDISNIALFLASQAADYITGTTIVVDGGTQHTTPNFVLTNQLVRTMWKSKL